MTASVQVQSHLHCSPAMAILNTCNLRAPLPWLLSDSSQGCPQAKTLLSRRFLVVLQVSQSCCPGTRTYCSGYLVYKLLVISACSQKLVLDDKVQSQMLSLFWLHQYHNFLSFPYHESGAKNIYILIPFCTFFKIDHILKSMRCSLPQLPWWQSSLSCPFHGKDANYIYIHLFI